MTLTLPADAEPFGTDWDLPGCYVLRYEPPENSTDAVDAAFETRPPWTEALAECSHCLYVGEATNVMRRLEDHNNQNKRLTTLSRIGCEPVGIEAIEYHASKEAAEHAEYNTAVRMDEQTGDDVLVIVNGEAL
jgi:predicted GIY-YIG superfamily endonuclease